MGKVFGAIIGFFVGSLPGAVIGFLLGLWFDHSRARLTGNSAEAQRVFFRSTFAVMGYVSKADGRVTETEIAAAEQLMQRLALTPESRREAIRQFNRGKGAGFDLDAELTEFRHACRGRINLVRMFLEIQIQTVLADGQVTNAEKEAIRAIARGLGLSDADVARLEAMLSAGAGGWQGDRPAEDTLREAYAVLGVSEAASDADIKKAYRHLMNQHHPDKLVSKGLPEEMMKMAEEKTRQISAAYDTIRKARAEAA